MKKRIKTIWGIGLVVVLLAAMLLPVLPAAAGTLSWGEVKDDDVPSTDGKILQTNIDLYNMAVSTDGQTIYVAAGEEIKVGDHVVQDGGLYKSTNGGETWSKVSPSSLKIDDVMYVAIAPDDPDVLVAVGDIGGGELNVRLSTNGASSFSSLDNSNDQVTDGDNYIDDVTDVAIAPLSGSTRYIAIAGTDDDGYGCVYYFNLGVSAPVWKDAVKALGDNGPDVDAVEAVAFSPNFPSDEVMVVVCSESGAEVTVDIASFNQEEWDDEVFDNYPIKLKDTGGDFIMPESVEKADIALDPEYLGGDDTTRIAFVALAATDNVDGEVGGVWRLKDTSQHIYDDIDNIGFNSVAWDGTNLAAGEYYTNTVRRSADALVSSPTVSASTGTKEIGVEDGMDQVVVAWSGSTLVGIKQGDASAFGMSTDDGKTWNDIALIDVDLDNWHGAYDMWISPEGDVMYLVCEDDDETSVFRYDGSWMRVLTLDDISWYMVRAAASDPDAVYIAEWDSKTMWYSKDGGVEKWTKRASRYYIQDLAVQDADVAYIANIENDEVSKSTNGGFTWGSDQDSKAGGGNCYSLNLIGEDMLLLGTDDGYVSYSADGNGSWNKIGTQLHNGNYTVVTASGLADGDYIYAATDGPGARVERWEIGQSGDSWKNLEAPSSGNYTSIVLYGGALYAMSVDWENENSTLDRTIEPETSSPGSSKWSTKESAGEIFGDNPAGWTPFPYSMMVTSGSNKLYAIDWTGPDADTGIGLYTYTDTLADVGLDLVSPAEGYKNPINTVSGGSQDISFSWTKPTTGDIGYQVRIYASDGTTILTTATKDPTDSSTPNILIGPYQDSDKGQALSWAPGQTYYWAVRVNDPVYSPWSEKRSFSIEPLAAQVPNILAPANGGSITQTSPAYSWTPISGTTQYQFQLALNPGFSPTLVDQTVATTGIRPVIALDTGLDYFWRVRALSPVQGDWSAIANFMVTEPAPEPSAPVVITQTPPPQITIPAPAPAPTITIPSPTPPAQIAPGYIWAIIIIGAVLVIAVIVLIVRTRRSV